MQGKINRSIMLQTFISTLLLTFFLSSVFYSLLAVQVKTALKDKAEILKEAINEADDLQKVLHLLTVSEADFRFSLILPDGKVSYDSKADISHLDNHRSREEVIQALETGHGESARFSNTFQMKNYYVALRLNNGSVLRLSQSSSSVFGIFANSLPAMLLVIAVVLLIGNILSKRLTRSIIAPINTIDLNSEDIATYDELTPFVRTIAQQRQRLAAQMTDLENRAATINIITGSMREGLVLLDKQGMILSANKSALDLFEASEAVTGKNILELTRQVKILENAREAISGKSGDMFFSQEDKSYQVFFSPVADSGAIVLFLNITDKVEAEKLRREFSANVTHELKTPLTSISGYAEMIHHGIARQEDIQGFAGKIKDESARLILLINHILMISRLDEESGIIERQKINLRMIVNDVVDALALKLAENNISIEISGEELFVQANHLMMHEMLYNLIDNGIKYNRPGGDVAVSLQKENDKAIISVKDTGIGISKEHQGRVFERFYRVDKSRSKKTGGTGLGLSIVKHIVQAHGGTIDMLSKDSEGTEMIITLPGLVQSWSNNLSE